MTTVSTVTQSRRKRPATYGKVSRNVNTWNVDDFSDERHPLVKEDAYTQARNTKLRALQSEKPHAKSSKDAWDVPSSGEEEELSPIKRISPPRTAVKRKLIRLFEDTEEVPLAPWERRKAEAPQSVQDGAIRHNGPGPISVDVQRTNELSDYMQGRKATQEDRQPSTLNREDLLEDLPDRSSSKASGASARLQAKKLSNGNASTPRASQKVAWTSPQPRGQDSQTSSRKRLHSADKVAMDSADVHMPDAQPSLLPHPSTATSTGTVDAEGADLLDVPGPSADEPAFVEHQVHREQNSRRRADGEKLVTYSSVRNVDPESRNTDKALPPSKETSFTTALLRSKSQSGSPTQLDTPKPNKLTTPRLNKTWKLSQVEPKTQSPSTLPMEDLKLTSRPERTSMLRKRTSASSVSSPDQRRRAKLVDRLKATPRDIYDETSEDSELGGSSGDSDVDNDFLTAENNEQKMDDITLQEQSQKQNQNQGTATKTGPKVTYSRTRSYLPEDDFEDNLMFELVSDSPRRSEAPQRRGVNSKTASQKSTFDLDVSDEEETAGKLRTIHELRAGGTNQRFVDDIGGLLEDIKDHNASGRGRRRSALIDLALRLADKVFADKFFRQSYEQSLLVECSAAPDDIADFALAAAFATMLSGEHPEHVVESLKDGGLLHWLARLLRIRADITALAKDRKSNMSKSAQGTLATFVGAFAKQEAIWGETKPTKVTPRLVALKASDQIIQKVRRSGDTIDVLVIGDLEGFLPETEEIVAMDEFAITSITLGVSALESLSTAMLSTTWPLEVLKRIRSLLLSSSTWGSKTQYLLFLVLRLCLNVTNENAEICKVFSKQGVIVYLLRAISSGFERLYSDLNEENCTVDRDILVLAIGILSNITEQNDDARQLAATDKEALPLLKSLVDIFDQGQRRLLEAISVEQTITNVVYGYLAVVLANFCKNRKAKQIIIDCLPNRNLASLVNALEEFVAHHQRVDTLNFEGTEGAEVWSAFTEKLRIVLSHLKAEVVYG